MLLSIHGLILLRVIHNFLPVVVVCGALVSVCQQLLTAARNTLMILILVVVLLLLIVVKALILLVLLLLLNVILLHLVLIVVDAHLRRHGMIGLNGRILRESHAVLLARNSGRLLADRGRRRRNRTDARIISRTVTINGHSLMHGIHQMLRPVRLALHARVEAGLGLGRSYTVHVGLVGDRFKWRQLAPATGSERRPQMRRLLRLEIHVIDVFLLLEGGTHGCRLRRAAVGSILNAALVGVLGAAPLLLLMLLIVVRHVCRWVRQILELHGVVSLYLQQAFALKEVLAPLERRLLLHLLKGGRVCHGVRRISRHILTVFRKIRIVVCQHGLISLLLVVLVILPVMIVVALTRRTSPLMNIEAVDVGAEESRLRLLRIRSTAVKQLVVGRAAGTSHGRWTSRAVVRLRVN